MAATSPYSQNDYASVSNFRPYDLPINDIYKSITAEDEFWRKGAERIKSVYDNALNLKLSLEPNKEIRRKYIEDADKQLTKLSTMDVADPSVQRQGFALFKPLFQDEGIIYDDLTTRHYDKVRQDALMYRGKDNGKGYSDINMQYAMQGYGEFMNSKDRMAGKAAYENRKEYTPYYDYTDDFSKALKDCKPSSVDTQTPDYGGNGAITGYMKESSMKTLSAGQAKGCLEAGLSPNASRQLQIEGSVAYKNNPDVLASDTATYLSGVGTNLSDELQSLHAKKAALMKNTNGLTPAELATVNAQIDEQAKGVSDELDRTNTSIKKISSGDMTDILNNFDQTAGSIYSYKKLYKKALASSFEDRKEFYKADPVQLSAIKFTQDKYLKQLDNSFDVSLEAMKEGHDKEMKMLDLMYGGAGKDGKGQAGTDIFRNPLTGEITLNPNLQRETGNLRDKPVADPKVYEKLTQEVNDLNGQDQSNNLRLYNNLVSRAERDKSFRDTLLKGFNLGTTDDEWTRFKTMTANNNFLISSKNGPGGLQETTWFKAYTQGQPNDEDVNKWSGDNMLVQAGLGTLNRKIDIAEKQVAKEIGGDFQTQINNTLTTLKPVQVGNTSITPKEIQDAIEGKAGRVSLKDKYVPGNFTGPGMGTPGTTSKEIYVNGQLVQETAAYKLYEDISDKNSEINSSLASKRSEVYNKLGFDREPWYFTPNDKAPLVQTIKSILPKDPKGKDVDVSIISSDFSGGVRISVPGVKKGDDAGGYLAKLRDAGVGTSAEATDDNIITLKGTTYNVINQAINNPILGQAAYQLSTVGETTAFAQTQPGAKVPDSDIKIPIMQNGKMRQMTIETYKNDTSPEFRVYLEGATDSRPFITASNAYELFEKIGRAPVELNKPLK